LRELELLLALAAEARAGRIRLPLDELERVQVTPEELARPPWPPALASRVRERHRELRAALAAGVEALGPAERAALRGVIVWASLAAAHSRRAVRALPLARETGYLFDGWRAWRAARRADAGRSLRAG
jgi:phytoene/squalene synthetase